MEAQHAAMATTGTAAGAVRPRIRFHMLVALTFAVGGCDDGASRKQAGTRR